MRGDEDSILPALQTELLQNYLGQLQVALPDFMAGKCFCSIQPEPN